MSQGPLTLVAVLTRTEAWFRDHGIDTPRLDAELLLAHVLGMDRISLYLNHDRPMSAAELSALRPLVRRRGGREPLAWVLGSQGFHAIDLHVRAGVLVPRPDTETLVEAALEWIPTDADPVYIADVGCGSGAVGLAIATARLGARIYATDLAPIPLQVTRQNTEALGLSQRVAVLQGDLLQPIPEHRPIDWVVSNPPYIPSDDLDGLMPEVSVHEPRLALDGGPNGLATVRRLIDAARDRVRRGILLEVGAGQAQRVAQLLSRAGFNAVRTWADLGGLERVVGGLRDPSKA